MRMPGKRIALNIVGDAEKEQLNRGDWLLSDAPVGRGFFPGDRFWRFMRRFPNGSRYIFSPTCRQPCDRSRLFAGRRAAELIF